MVYGSSLKVCMAHVESMVLSRLIQNTNIFCSTGKKLSVLLSYSISFATGFSLTCLHLVAAMNNSVAFRVWSPSPCTEGHVFA